MWHATHLFVILVEVTGPRKPVHERQKGMKMAVFHIAAFAVLVIMIAYLAKESLTDLYSSVIVILIIILSIVPFLSCIDFIGTIGIAIFILFTAFKILKENILALLGSVEENEALLTNIKIELKAIKNVEIKDIELFKYGFYYQANLKIKISSSMNVLKLINLEKKIQKIVKKKKYGIKYVNIEICT